jgi:hypothetical protein
MKTLVKEVKAYRFEELNEFARETAKMNYLENEHLPEFFSEDLTETLKEQFRLSNLNTYYSLSNCQGDGLCLHGHITHSELFSNGKFKEIVFKGIHHRQIQSVYDELQKIDFIHSSRYYYAKTVSIESIEYNPTGKQSVIIEQIIENVKSWYFEFCREWEKCGYSYFYEISDEDMIDGCELGDYWFTGDGQVIDTDKYKEAI